MERSGRVGDFQCKLRRGRRERRPGEMSGKRPEGSKYSTTDQGCVSAPFMSRAASGVMTTDPLPWSSKRAPYPDWLERSWLCWKCDGVAPVRPIHAASRSVRFSARSNGGQRASLRAGDGIASVYKLQRSNAAGRNYGTRARRLAQLVGTGLYGDKDHSMHSYPPPIGTRCNVSDR